MELSISYIQFTENNAVKTFRCTGSKLMALRIFRKVFGPQYHITTLVEVPSKRPMIGGVWEFKNGTVDQTISTF